jgi:peptidoglycan/LPS O-acetylase OafA/YrhL
MEYRKEIDGLRAVAVLPVILFHAGFQVFSGGFVGVDVFFVISGYLITSILLAEIQSGEFSLVNFYERRARRILPALFVTMFVSIFVSWFWLLPRDMQSFSQSLVAVSIFSSNILFWLTSGYFDSTSELKPLLHTWSLAVEEQYYLIFPLFLMLIWKIGKKYLASILTVVAVISIALAQYCLMNNQTQTAFYLLPTRGWELLMGSLVALFLFNSPRYIPNEKASQIGAGVGLTLLCYAIFAFSKQTPFPGFYALVPTLGTALIIIFATEQTIVGKLLSNRAFVGIGLISYSAYLWHQPLFAFARHFFVDEPGQLLLGGLTLVTIVIAYCSWKYVEKPFRDKQRFSRKSIFIYSVFGSLVFISFGLVGHFEKGFVNRFSQSQQEILKFEKFNITNVYKSGTCFLDWNQSYLAFSNQCAVSSADNSIMIWGDSHAASLSFGLRKQFTDVIQYTASGCPPIKDVVIDWRPNCKKINDYVIEEITRITPKQIFLLANWSLYGDQFELNSLGVTIKYIKKVSPKSSIYIIGPIPQWRPSLPKLMVKQEVSLDGIKLLRIASFEQLKIIDGLLNQLAYEEKVNFLSPLDVMCEHQRCLATSLADGSYKLTAWDYGHLTDSGSILLARKLLNINE